MLKHTFKKPFNFEGVEYTELEFNFEGLSGADLIAQTKEKIV